MLDKLLISNGASSPLGLSLHGDTANFALFSHHATQVTLGLFWDEKVKTVPLNRTGDIWHVAIQGIPPHGISYAFQCEGSEENLYNPKVWLADPYAKVLKNQI